MGSYLKESLPLVNGEETSDMSRKVMVAMSGGVDSAVAALLIKNTGYDTAGITMKVWDNGKAFDDSNNTVPDVNCIDAKAIADTLDIPHYTVQYGESFRKCVIDRFLSDYRNGLTPNPCVECNKHIKFGKLYDSANDLGYDTLATGHYAQIVRDGDSYLLKKAADSNKDQSYFLWGIKKELLPHLLFPLGGFTKPEIREMAESNGFSNAHRSDSQDICFITDGDYVSFIKAQDNTKYSCGSFIDVQGKTIGQHSGIINYTIGQRKGLGVVFGVPMFVSNKNAADNTVTLCTNEQLYRDTLTARAINLLVDCDFDHSVRLQAKIRYRHTSATATITRIDDDRLSVKFDIPQRAIAPGQSLVLYDGDTVIGGGIIE